MLSKKSVSKSVSKLFPKKTYKVDTDKYAFDVSFSTAIKKVGKQVHPNLGIGYDALTQLNAFINLLGNLLVFKGLDLLGSHVRISNKNSTVADKSTLGSREIQSAVKLIMPGELSKHAISEGTKALTKYQGASAYEDYKKTGPTGKNSSKSAKAGLSFPISRIEYLIRKNYKGRVSSGVPVYLTAVLEYITAELLELSGNATMDNKRKIITPRNLFFATEMDEELGVLIHRMKWIWMNSGVAPYIENKLLNKSKKKSKKRSSKKSRRSFGLGFGRSIKKKFVLRDNIYGITKPAIKRLSYRAGIVRMSGLVYEELRGIILHFLEKLLRDIIIYADYKRKRTIGKEDVYMAAKHKFYPVKVPKRLINSFGSRKNKALSEIRYYQKHPGLLLAQLPFDRVVREVAQNYKADLRFSASAFYAIQELTEIYLVKLLQDANKTALTFDIHTVTPKHIALVRYLQRDSLLH
jgi:histone H2A